MTDPLERLLGPPTSPGGGAFRDALFRRTAVVLRRRRRLRALARGAALAACYLAGLLTTHGLERRTGTPQEAPPARVGLPVPREIPPPASALAAEWQAFDSPDRRAELYRTAGDRYLAEEADPLAAVRCYGNALNADGPRSLTVGADDSWLLMAIKDARQKEKRDANATN